MARIRMARRRTRKLRRKMMRKPLMLRKTPRLNVLNVKRTAWIESWTLSTASTVGFWRYYQFTVANIPSSAEFTNLFDTYRIKGVRITFRPRYSGFSGNDTTDTTLPGITNQAGNYVHVINDPYSTVTPSGTYTTTNLNSFLENGNVKTYNGNKPFSVYVSKPTIDTYRGGTATASRVKAPWMQTTAANQPHNGVHVFLQDTNMTGTSGQTFDVFYTIYAQFKNLK